MPITDAGGTPGYERRSMF